MTGSVTFDRESVSAVPAAGDVHHVTSVGNRVTRLFWQVVQVVIFPVGIYRYFANRSVYKASDHGQLVADSGYQRVRVTTADGVVLDGVKSEHKDQKGKAADEQRWVIRLCARHGCYEERIRSYGQLRDVGDKANVLAFNYRGVGESRGYQWSAFDPVVDAEAMVQYLLNEGVKEENIEIRGTGFRDEVGRSLQKHHPELKFAHETACSMRPEGGSFKVETDVFGTYRVWNVLWKGFWEVVLLPLWPLRSWVTRQAIMPATGQKRERLDEVRDVQLRELRRGGCALEVRRHTVQTADGVKLDTCELRHPDDKVSADQKWIVFLTGNGGYYEGHLTELAKIARDTRANIYTGNYRGVGYSEGFPWSSQDLVLDGEAMVQHLLSRRVPPENIIVHGWSMGGGVAAAVAAEHPGIHLCSDRSFASFYKEVEVGMAPALASAADFIGWRFDSVANHDTVRGAGGDVVVMWHPDDPVIPEAASLHMGLSAQVDHIRYPSVDGLHPHCNFVTKFPAAYEAYKGRVRGFSTGCCRR